jgi:crossover junction endodeoxyribonuclease RuvC
MRILGVDPGSRLTGFGLIDLVDRRMRHVAHGTLRLSNTGGKAVIPLHERLLSIHEGLSGVIQEHRPQVMVVERAFFAKNAASALKLGQARGVVIVTGAMHDLEMAEYSPSEIKSALTGHGQADKFQVARMVEILLGQNQKFGTSDASDALAIALCHAQTLGAGGRAAAGSGLAAWAGRSSRRSSNSLADALGITAESVEGRKSFRRGESKP